MSLDTPQGIKTAYNVVEIYGSSISIPASGVMQRAKGEALYLDTGARPLIALLGRSSWSRSNPLPRNSDAQPQADRPTYLQWQWNNPTNFLWSLYAVDSHAQDDVDVISIVSGLRGKRPLTTDELPDLVTFADVNDPKSVQRVDPNNLEATLGPGVKWRSMTIEVVSTWFTGLTSGIEDKLPWLRTMPEIMHLDGQSSGGGPGSSLANSLQSSDFIHKHFY